MAPLLIPFTAYSSLTLLGLLLLGSCAGFTAGLLGVGGGMVMVPFMTMLFTAQHFPPEHLVHIAIATSLTSIVFTSLSSMRAHHSRGAVQWHIVYRLAPGIVLGALIGTQFAPLMNTRVLSFFFALFVGFSATQMWFDRKPAAARELPGTLGLLGTGSFIGALASLVGAGGGFISVPFMTWCNVKIHQAIATSAALGFPIALSGALGYVIAGLREPAMPPGNIGFINVPALLCVVVTSVWFAPLGAKTAHTMNVKSLKRAFAVLLYGLAAYMFSKGWHTLPA